MKDIVKAALKVAKKYPVFPTDEKRPTWGNKELGLKRGQGGFKIATQDPEEVAHLFSHPRATEIAVPMGEMSGLMCLDVDLYKLPHLTQWVEDNAKYLGNTLWHRTRSGGLHIFFKHPGGSVKFPATLREGIDIKAVGTGYVCWPPTDGYEVCSSMRIQEFPMELLREAMKEKGGSGNLPHESFSDTTDDELVRRINTAEDFYGSLRTLSWRLPLRTNSETGRTFTKGEVILILETIMDDSAAASPDHLRHDDWHERYEKIEELVDSAYAKLMPTEITPELSAIMDPEGSLIDVGGMQAALARPIGPQRETTAADIESKVKALQSAESSGETGQSTGGPETPSEFTVTSLGGLRELRIAPLEWVIPDMLPKASTCSLAGTSNVGKTRWLASLIAGLAASDTARMGLPQCETGCSTLWLANEERVEDIQRRVKAVALQHGDTSNEHHIVIRGKDDGMLRLVALNETGVAELDEDNIAKVVAAAIEHNVRLIVFDPYVTLSDAMDENSATSAAMLTKAFLIIANLTGATVFYAHHTPKDRTKAPDWYRGDSGGWRGSGAIYSALDCGFTLASFIPKNPEQRREWLKLSLDQRLSRWIVLDTGKIREGEPLEPVVYELVGQEMDEGEGRPIGVARRSSQAEAVNSLLDSAIDVLGATAMAEALEASLGAGKHTNMKKVHKAMKGHECWPDVATLASKHLEAIYAQLETPILLPAHTVWMEQASKTARHGRWSIHIEENDDEV